MLNESFIRKHSNGIAVEAVFKPILYNLSLDKDKRALEDLLQGNKNISVFDEIRSQLEELIKLANPTQRLSTEDYEHLIKKHLNGATIEEYGVWVYYPWSNRLVHLLDEEDFIKVRTSRNQYKITPEEQDFLRNKKIGVIGLSVGQSVSLALSIERICGELRIADFDTLELSNINRIRTGIHNIGTKKTILVAREIAEIDPFLPVYCFHEGITESNIDFFLTEGGKLDILIDECDGLDVKVMCRQRAKSFEIPVVMEASDRGTIDVERFDLDPQRPILHGFIDHLDVSKIRYLKTNEEKIPYLLSIAGGETISDRAKASMLEIGQTITTWPQLGSSVMYGGGITADLCRRILLGEFTDSGRYFIDLDELIKNKTDTEPIVVSENISSNIHPSLTIEEMKRILEKHAIPNVENQVIIPQETIIEIVKAGTMAPSLFNGQPWKWIYHQNTLYLFADLSYRSKVKDYLGSSSCIGLGAATENVILKAHLLGLEVELIKFPLTGAFNLVAAFRFFAKGDSSNRMIEDHTCDALVSYIPDRATNRKITHRQLIDHTVLSDLQTIVKSTPGASLKIIHEESAIAQLSEVIAKVERIQIMQKQGYLDFIYESRWTKEEVEATWNGIDIQNIDLPPGQIASLQMAKSWKAINYLNKWKRGFGLERFVKAQAASASAIGLLTMPSFSNEDFYMGGRAMEKIWLDCTRKNIAFHPITTTTLLFNSFLYDHEFRISPAIREELKELRDKFEKLFSIDHKIGEVMLFRIFLAEVPEKKSLRIPVEKIFSFSGDGK